MIINDFFIKKNNSEYFLHFFISSLIHCEENWSYRQTINSKLFTSWNNEVWNGNSEFSAICQYVCQSVLFVQPIRSFNLISMLVHCLHLKITTCLLVLINQLKKWDNSFSCELVSSLSAYESCLIYLEQSCHSILSSSMPQPTVYLWH